MVFEKLFGKGFREMSGDEFIELDTSELEKPEGKIPIKVDKIEDFADSDRIQKLVRDGSIVWAYSERIPRAARAANVGRSPSSIML